MKKIGQVLKLIPWIAVAACQIAPAPQSPQRPAAVAPAQPPTSTLARPTGYVELEKSAGGLRAPQVPSAGETPPAVWLATPDGWSVFTVQNVDGADTINGGYEYEVGVRVSDTAVDETALLGQLVTVGIRLDKERERFLNGYVTSVDRGDDELYRLKFQPWTALLSRTANCTIFEQASAASILHKVFDRYRFASYQFNLGGSYPVFDIFAQYRETDLNLVQRLAEDAGVATFFRHEARNHTLMLVDGPHGYLKMNPVDSLEVGSGDGRLRVTGTSWDLKASRYRLRASALQDAEAIFESTGNVPRAHGPNTLEVYDFEQGPRNQQEMEFYAQLRAEEMQSRARILSGSISGDVAHAGMAFALSGHPAPLWNGSYLVVATRLRVRTTENEPNVGTTIEAVPLDVPYRPMRRTPLPVINGPQLATVVAQDGEARPGRLKVLFHWAARAADQEVWLPMSRAIPTSPSPGTQVIVSFLDGDPNRAIVTDVLGSRAP